MSDFIKNFHFHMFDGEGGDAGASAEGSAESNAEPTVVYGKEEAEETESQVGADTEETAEEPVDLDAEFEELIHGKYKEQYGERVKKSIDARFRNSADFEKQVNAYKDATAPLAMMYGVDIGDIEGLKKAIERNDGLYAQQAEEEGLTVQKYRENLRLKADAQRGRTMQEEFRRQIEMRDTFDRWNAEAEELTEAFPSFDLEQELENQTFIDTLNRVGTVRDAFLITHLQDILSGAIDSSAKTAQQQTVQNFQARAARPVENGVSTQPAIVRKDDPSKMTKEELFEVAERARKGEKIRF